MQIDPVRLSGFINQVRDKRDSNLKRKSENNRPVAHSPITPPESRPAIEKLTVAQVQTISQKECTPDTSCSPLNCGPVTHCSPCSPYQCYPQGCYPQ